MKVGAHGIYADAELCGNVLIVQAPGDQICDRLFGRSESMQKRENRDVRFPRSVVGKVNQKMDLCAGGEADIDNLHIRRESSGVRHSARRFRLREPTLSWTPLPLGEEIFAGETDFLRQTKFRLEHASMVRAQSPKGANSDSRSIVKDRRVALIEQQRGRIVMPVLRVDGVRLTFSLETANSTSGDIELDVQGFQEGHFPIGEIPLFSPAVQTQAPQQPSVRAKDHRGAVAPAFRLP